jgi:hypothetical protein
MAVFFQIGPREAPSVFVFVRDRVVDPDGLALTHWISVPPHLTTAHRDENQSQSRCSRFGPKEGIVVGEAREDAGDCELQKHRDGEPLSRFMVRKRAKRDCWSNDP